MMASRLPISAALQDVPKDRLGAAAALSHRGLLACLMLACARAVRRDLAHRVRARIDVAEGMLRRRRFCFFAMYCTMGYFTTTHGRVCSVTWTIGTGTVCRLTW